MPAQAESRHAAAAGERPAVTQWWRTIVTSAGHAPAQYMHN
jgi:hypothetical protein